MGMGLSSLSPCEPTAALYAAYEQRIRAQKLRLQMAAAKRDAEVYVGRAEQAVVIGKIQERKAAAAADAAAGGGSESGSKRKRAAGSADGLRGGSLPESAVVRRQFRQRQPLPDRLMGTHVVAGGGADEDAT